MLVRPTSTCRCVVCPAVFMEVAIIHVQVLVQQTVSPDYALYRRIMWHNNSSVCEQEERSCVAFHCTFAVVQACTRKNTMANKLNAEHTCYSAKLLRTLHMHTPPRNVNAPMLLRVLPLCHRRKSCCCSLCDIMPTQGRTL